MLDYKTQAYYPQVQAANSIKSAPGQAGLGVSAYYMGCGGEFESNVKTPAGSTYGAQDAYRVQRHRASRQVFQGAVLEVHQGRESGRENDQQNMKDYYNDMPEKQQIAELKRMLFVHGLTGTSIGIRTR